MNRKFKSFFAAFALTGILVGAWCGFAAVDLSTEKYMPGQFGPLLEISRIGDGSVEYSFLAERHILDVKPPKDILAVAKKYRGLLPALPQIFSSLAADGMDAVLKRTQAHELK